MVAGNGGLVPLPNGDWHAMAVDPNTPPPEVRRDGLIAYCSQWGYVCIVDIACYKF